MAVRSKAVVCGLSHGVISGSNPTRLWRSVCCECCVLAGIGIYGELNTCPEESYRLCCVETSVNVKSRLRRPAKLEALNPLINIRYEMYVSFIGTKHKTSNIA